MRPIKFRAWDKKKKRMERVSYFDFDKNGKIGCVDLVKDFEMLSNEIVLMQFIGKKDKKRKDIYELDILDWGDNFYSVVEWNKEECAWWLKELGIVKGEFCERTHSMMAYTGKPLIVGNIYENPQWYRGKNN